jgi:phosphatidylglycerophosphate synthase
VLSEGYRIYLATRKKNDQLFNHYFMRPIAGVTVAVLAKTPITPNQVTILNLALFIVASALFVALPGTMGGLIAALALEVSYLFDCADGMLARHKKIASKTGHLFDFFTDEIKALLLVSALGLRAAFHGGYGPNLAPWDREGFLVATVFAAIVVASATSLTNFVRRPELTGQETPVEAHYETVEKKKAASPLAMVKEGVLTFLRFLNHYPSHIYLFALVGRLDVFFWMYASLNLLYLGQGWLGLLLRFGRFPRDNTAPKT